MILCLLLIIIYSRVLLPSFSVNVCTSSVSVSCSIVSLILQNTGVGNHQSNREVNPLPLFCKSSIIGNAAWDWVKPTNVKEV